QSEVNDLAVRIARELDGTEFDPAELETITGRLDALERMKRKYGDSIQKVLSCRERFRATIDDFSNRDERAAELQREVDSGALRLGIAAKRLSGLRRKAADHLRQRMKEELTELALPSARFEATFRELDEIGPEGAEQIEFVLAANIGEPERPLVRVASGGELSRVLLALVVVLAAARERTTLIFDEIDAGIGGVTAAAVSQRLEKLARMTQVLCVTHLAQIASGADRHYVLEKRENAGVTSIEVSELEGKAGRTAELARMLSGQTHAAALRHAALLLERGSTPA
ncbi:MAG: DNA repair protein RecN, partial [Candidatus Baltobacteraceae bacterium]